MSVPQDAQKTGSVTTPVIQHVIIHPVNMMQAIAIVPQDVLSVRSEMANVIQFVGSTLVNATQVTVLLMQSVVSAPQSDYSVCSAMASVIQHVEIKLVIGMTAIETYQN